MQNPTTPQVLKNIPKGINRRLSEISSSEYEFDKAKPQYQKALESSGYHFDLQYEQTGQKAKRSR